MEKCKQKIIACFFIIILGCTPKMIIYMDGVLLQDKYEIFHAQDVIVKWYFVGWYKEKIKNDQGDEEFIYFPDYLLFDDIKNLEKYDIIQINLKILNRKNIKYKININGICTETIREYNSLNLDIPKNGISEIELYIDSKLIWKYPKGEI